MTDPYQTAWDPRAYLRQFYADPRVAADEQAQLAFAARKLRAAGRRFPKVLEVGCGPTVHHAAALAPYADEIHLSDYLPANLAEVRRALAGDPAAHDWTVYLGGCLAAEGSADADPVARLRLLAERVTTLQPADLREPETLGRPGSYDLVASYYCLEAVARSRDEWARGLGHLARLLRPGGVLLLGAMRRCREYRVFDRPFPVIPVDEADFAAELARFEFAPARTEITVAPAGDWAGHGFDTVCCVWAERPG
jgi:SAM-dependent methyltransferase